jgi:hypothetical protein
MYIYSKYRKTPKQRVGRYIVALGFLVLVSITFAILPLLGERDSSSQATEVGAPAASNTAKQPKVVFADNEAQLEYRLLRTELKLAEEETLYFLLNFRGHKLQLKLKGAVVWEYPLEIPAIDSKQLERFIFYFRGDNAKLVRPLLEKHLYTAQEQTPDSILAIISEATKFDPKLLQRDLPARFQLHWQPGLVLDIHSDIEGKPKSRLANTFMGLKHTLTHPFGLTSIVIHMPGESALTLYRAALPGLPTLIVPPTDEGA